MVKHSCQIGALSNRSIVSMRSMTTPVAQIYKTKQQYGKLGPNVVGVMSIIGASRQNYLGVVSVIYVQRISSKSSNHHLLCSSYPVF